MSGCATPATQNGAAPQAPNPGPSAPPSTISGTPATQNDGTCEFVPRLPRETKVDTVCVDKECVDKECVDKVCVDKECVDKECVDKVCVDKECVTKSVWTKSVLTKCHVKRKWMSGCATPATQNGAAPQAPNPGPSAPPSTISGTPATQNDGTCEFVPRLPRETKVDVKLCHACHAKWRGAPGAKSGPKRATQYHKWHACHAKRRYM